MCSMRMIWECSISSLRILAVVTSSTFSCAKSTQDTTPRASSSLFIMDQHILKHPPGGACFSLPTKFLKPLVAPAVFAAGALFPLDHRHSSDIQRENRRQRPPALQIKLQTPAPASCG